MVTNTSVTAESPGSLLPDRIRDKIRLKHNGVRTQNATSLLSSGKEGPGPGCRERERRVGEILEPGSPPNVCAKLDAIAIFRQFPALDAPCRRHNRGRPA